MSTHEKLEFNAVIENVIEITRKITSLTSEYDEISDLGINEVNHNILDWAEEFEARFGYTFDWGSSPYDYITTIDDFATKKIMELSDVSKDKWPKQNTDIDFDKPGRWL